MTQHNAGKAEWGVIEVAVETIDQEPVQVEIAKLGLQLSEALTNRPQQVLALYGMDSVNNPQIIQLGRL